MLSAPQPVPARVSVLIPAFNAAAWIAQAIESALSQGEIVQEVIVVDDGSTDGTLDVVRKFGDAVQLYLGQHAGGNATRNRLLHLATAEWVEFLDADDYLLPNKIRDQIQFADTQPSALDVVYSPVILLYDETGTECLVPISEGDHVLHFIQWGPFQTSAILWRRAALLDVQGWNETQPACQEHELILRLIFAGKRFGLWNHAATMYRVLSGTVSRKNPLRTLQLRMELTDRLEVFISNSGRRDPSYQIAFYTARMEAARSAWLIDRSYAEGLAQRAATYGQHWVTSPALPFHFQIVCRTFGFQTASRLATLRRRYAQPIAQ